VSGRLLGKIAVGAALAIAAQAFGALPDPDTRGTKCNVDPTINRVDVVLANKTPEQFTAALLNNPAYRAPPFRHFPEPSRWRFRRSTILFW
jgi:hypothetical protein